MTSQLMITQEVMSMTTCRRCCVAAIETAIVAGLILLACSGAIWAIRVGLDRDNAYEDAKESAYWEMRAGAPEDRYGN